jgi:hypothetical protein
VLAKAKLHKIRGGVADEVLVVVSIWKLLEGGVFRRRVPSRLSGFSVVISMKWLELASAMLMLIRSRTALDLRLQTMRHCERCRSAEKKCRGRPVWQVAGGRCCVTPSHRPAIQQRSSESVLTVSK